MPYNKPVKRRVGLSNPTRQNYMTRSDVIELLSEMGLTEQQEYHQLEPLEVMDIYRDGEGRVKQPGSIIGRYCISQNIKPPENMKLFRPLNSNMIQMPLVGEIYVGFDDEDGNSYYVGRINKDFVKVNQFDFDRSGNIRKESINTTDASQAVLNSLVLQEGEENKRAKPRVIGKYVEQSGLGGLDSAIKANVYEGDTLIQGRFNNFIRLGSNTNKPATNTGNIKIVSGLTSRGEDPRNDASSIYLTTNEQLKYPEPTAFYDDEGNLDFSYDRYGNKKHKSYAMSTVSKSTIRGQSTDKKNPNRTMNIEKYDGPQILLNSERLVLNADGYKTYQPNRGDGPTEDVGGEIGIFARNTVHIKGSRVQISNTGPEGSISLNASSVASEYKQKLSLTKDLNDAKIILAPDNMQELGAIFAKQVEWNLDFLKVQLASLIPAAIPGTRAIPNPGWFTNIRNKIRNAKKLLEFNDLVFKLKWLDKTSLKTYTIDELKDAFKPVPGFGGIIDGLASLKDAKGKVDQYKQQIEAAKSQLESTKTEGLKKVASTTSQLKDRFVDDWKKIPTDDEMDNLADGLKDYTDEGGSLSEIGMEKINPRLEEYKDLKEREERFEGVDGNENIILRKRIDEIKEFVKNEITLGNADGAEQKILQTDVQIEAYNGQEVLADSFLELANEIQTEEK